MAKLAIYARKVAFWLFDLLNGGKVWKHLKDIRFQLEKGSSEEILRVQESNLNNLLGHARQNCRYYIGLSDLRDLSTFPVVNKNLIKERLDEFIADGNDPERLFSVITSGSTGTPFLVYHSKGKRQRNTADTIYFASLSGFKLGYRLFYLKIWVEEKLKSKLSYLLQNMVPIDVIHLNDREIELFLKRIETYPSAAGILGYASALESICKYLDRHQSQPLKSKVKSVIAMSESLNDYTRMAIEKYFGVTVFSRYSNLENGIIAQQESSSGGNFLINTASYHVEILQMDSNEAAGEGTLGRIVVTDLFNRAIPMIRYDTGDIGAMITDPLDSTRKYFSRIEGRKLDLLYDTQGNLVSSFLVYKNMWKYPEIDQYQLIQESVNHYTFRINIKSTFEKEDQLIKEFKTFLGEDADFRLEYVAELPLLASGKRRKIVNNYRKQ